MRVIAGDLGGRQFAAPRGHHTHPMSEKMRGALFNKLGDITGLHILDCFAGSGALAFEAVSRGAKTATLIEADRNAQKSINDNIKALSLNNVKLISTTVLNWSQTAQDQKFDIILADPPYDKLQFSSLSKLGEHLRPQGLFVLSWPGAIELPSFVNCDLLEHQKYGDGQLAFYRALP